MIFSSGAVKSFTTSEAIHHSHHDAGLPYNLLHEFFRRREMHQTNKSHNKKWEVRVVTVVTILGSLGNHIWQFANPQKHISSCMTTTTQKKTMYWFWHGMPQNKDWPPPRSCPPGKAVHTEHQTTLRQEHIIYDLHCGYSWSCINRITVWSWFLCAAVLLRRSLCLRLRLCFWLGVCLTSRRSDP